MGRPRKYLTEEDRAEALRSQKRDYFRRNAPRLNAARRGRSHRTNTKARELNTNIACTPYDVHMLSTDPNPALANHVDSEPAHSVGNSGGAASIVEGPPLEIRLLVRPPRYHNRVLGSDGPELRAHWKEKYNNKPLDSWFMRRRRGLRKNLSLLQELQGGTQTIISVRHFHGIWDNAIEELIDSDFGSWGAKIFELLTRDASKEDTSETLRACGRLDIHLRDLVEVTDDLAALARQVDPRGLSDVVEKVDELSKKAHTLKAALVQMLELHADGVEALKLEELVDGLLYQTVDFSSL